MLALNSYQTLAVGILLYYLGKVLKKNIRLLQTYCIPNPVIGGVLFALLNLALFESGAGAVKLDTVQQSFFMNMFFTSVGFSASYVLLKKGGRDVLVLTLVCAVLITFQDIIGVVLAKVTGLHPLLGLCAGSIPLVGGHGTSGAFGPMLEKMGAERATTVAIAMATFGLISGSLMGGPVAHRLLEKFHLHSTQEDEAESLEKARSMEENAPLTMTAENFMLAFGEILVSMGLGTLVSKFFTSIGLTFPGTVGDVSLNIFLSLAMMSLRIWELFDIAGPLFIIAVAQVLFMALYTTFVVFRAMGRDYDAAVEVSAVCGFGMGATPNAMANMSAITSNYGPAPRAFFAVPLVGAMFIDFCNSGIIMVFINLINR